MKKYSLKTKVFGFIKDWFYPIYFMIQLPFAIGACVGLASICLKDYSSRIIRILGMVIYYICGLFITLLPWWKAENFEEVINFIYLKSKTKDEKTINIVTDEEDE